MTLMADKNPLYQSDTMTLHCGDALSVLLELPDESVQCCVTSPPYWGLRDYGAGGQLGLEATPEEYVDKMVLLFREVRRVLRDDGTLWLNLGDCYASGGHHNSEGFNQRYHGKHYLTNKQGDTDRHRPERQRVKTLKPKDLVGIPWRVAFALQADGWYLRSDIIWAKPNPMPEPVTDRPTKAHEYIFLLAKSEKYYYDHEAASEPAQSKKGNARSFRGGGSYTAGNSFNNSASKERETHGNTVNESGKRNRRTVWTVASRPTKGAHFATFPLELIEPCVRAGSPASGVILDPFCGTGTTGLAALQLGCRFWGIDINREYLETLCLPRLKEEAEQMRLF